uniref:immunity protein TriTu family protein n=1 Tax=Corallococcus coralloides TaxID=184914 RepID=UPI000FFE509E|nr:hypothetical protein [Corallococcus coralloides]
MIDVLRSWCSEQEQGPTREGIKARFVEGGAESAYADLESTLTLGRASVWENGLCDLEILSITTGQQLLYQHHEGLQGSSLVPLLDALANRMMKYREG